GTASVEWVCEEFAGVDLSDKRLDRRLIKTAEQLVSSPASPINEACGDWASTQGAYRLFDNGNASCEAILEPHIQATLKRMAGVGGPVLVMQDTVFFSYGQHPKTRGLGPIGNSNSEHERGLIMHNALAFTAAGAPLGLLSQTTWARQEVPEEGYQENILRLQCTAIEERRKAPSGFKRCTRRLGARRAVCRSSRWPIGNRISSNFSRKPRNSGRAFSSVRAPIACSYPKRAQASRAFWKHTPAPMCSAP